MYQNKVGKYLSFARRDSTKIILAVVIVSVLFLAVSHFATIYEDVIKSVVSAKNPLSALLYIVVTIIAVVFAPLSTLPLLPLASRLWGPFWAAIFSVIGWSAGALIAFMIARKLGRPVVQRMVSIERLKKIESIIPKKHVFWALVLLRIGLPVDLLSYALGLFSNISARLYLSTTLVGITPFAFIFSYLGSFSVYTQTLALVGGVLIMIVGLKIIRLKAGS